MNNLKKHISIIGTVGLPAQYGGFETLCENLVHNSSNVEYSVYCSTKHYPKKLCYWKGAKLIYIPLKANGIQSIFYDSLSMLHAVFVDRSKTIIVLGVSGAILIPLLRVLSNTHIICNIDGLEWKRDKWNSIARVFLKFSEKIAVKYSHEVISDNQAIADYVSTEYNGHSHVIAYGGDHAFNIEPKQDINVEIPEEYWFCVCRIEKENNIHLILDAFSKSIENNLVFIGNWNINQYSRKLHEKYSNVVNITLLDPIYDLGVLRWIRESSLGFIHGHSAGGTNPSLVEAMWFSKPIIAYDCSYNRFTTNNNALYFTDTTDLVKSLDECGHSTNSEMGKKLFERAQKEYNWQGISNAYEKLARL